MAKQPHKTRRAQIEEIEPRILYSADFSPGLLQAAPLASVAETRSLDAVGEFAASSAQTNAQTPAQTPSETAAQAEHSGHEIVFVDTATPDYQRLVADIQSRAGDGPRVDVVLLDHQSDGIAQISAVLAGQHDISAVHLISHGSDGQVQLGSARLNFDTLLKNAGQIKGWGQALSADADVLIYGCDVAQNDDGKALVDALCRLTGADVAASENLTGAAARGGDWSLEYNTGHIDTSMAISVSEQALYSGVLSTYTVTSTADTLTAGTLRTAMTSANANAGADTINFAIVGAGVQTITLSSQLPTITEAVLLDGWTQGGVGYTGVPLIELNGTGAGGSARGLEINAANSTVRGFIINRFASAGIEINGVGSSGNVIQGNYLGTNSTGTAGSANAQGIMIRNGATGNTVGGTAAGTGNVLSGNTGDGINIWDSGTDNNVVLGNRIGVNAAGTAAVANQGTGIGIYAGASNTIGGTAAGAGNVISGNWFDGINTSGNNGVIQGNLIGVSATGSTAINNGGDGIQIDTASGNTIGGTTAGAINVISGNGSSGVYITNASSTNNIIVGNYIGIDSAGSAALGNGDFGILIDGGATGNTIGGLTSAGRNIISGNVDDGVHITGSGTSNNIVIGNYVGLNAAGTSAIGNHDGVQIALGATNNTIGGSAAGARNILSGNTDDGAEIKDTGTSGNILQGNWIGLNAAGTAAVSNADDGVAIGTSASNDSVLDNVISGNTANGTGADGIVGNVATGMIIQGNLIGLDPTGAFAIANSGSGIRLNNSGTTGWTIGGTGAGQGNTIANNGRQGIFATLGSGNSFLGNSIYSNGLLEIDIDASGVTANDAAPDADAGANNKQNFPVLTSASSSGGTTTIIGTLTSAFSATYRVEFFASSTADSSGHGEARRYLGFVSTTTNGSGAATFTASLSGSLSGGETLVTATATDATGNTSELALNVTPTISNAAPVLAGANDLSAINEDPVSNIGTLVSALLSGQVTDADIGAVFGIAVTATVVTNGAWEYSTNGGGNWTSFGTPSASAARLLASDASTYVRFVPNSNWNDTVSGGITFRAWDQTSGVAGSTADTSSNGGATAFSSATASSSITVSSVNDAPTGTNNIVTMSEDTQYTFAAVDFGFTDATDSPANALSAVTITTVPGAGSLTLSGVAVTAGQSISAANVTSGNLKFAPAANANGASYTSFTFQVQDDGGTANSGVDLDASANTMTINVTAVNDAPAGADNTVTTNEDAQYTFAAVDFGFSDPNDSPANTLSAVKITTITGVGSLTLSGVAVTAGQSISAANVSAGDLKFAPAANANGASYASFTFQVQDNGGIANSGVDLDASANTMSINVTAVNDAPAGTNNTVTTNEDAQYTFAAVDFGFTDPNDSPANALGTVRITTIPGAGSLTLSGVAVTAGQSVSAVNIAAGNLKFTPAANASGNGYASFTFQVQDDGGTANGGVDLDASANTMTIDVSAVNDAPAGTNNTVTATEDTQYTFAAVDFGFTDPNDSPANVLSAIRMTTIPGAGSLMLSGVAVTSGQSISAANVSSGNLKFTPAANANGASYASFTFQVQDDGGTTNGGVDLDASPNTMTISVTAVNDAPAGTNNTVTTSEDTQYTFAATDFGFTDPNDSPVDALSAVRIATIPGTGSLTLSGVAVTAGESVSAANIASGSLRFTPAANASGASYASFTFQVQDSGGNANGGVDLDASPNTMTVDVATVNDAPAGTNNTVTTNEDAQYAFAAVDFGLTDLDDSPANVLSAVRITTIQGLGSLTLSGIAVTAGQSISAANIASGNLKFTPAVNASGASYASFTFQVQDDGGVVNGGVDLDASANTMTIDVTAVNDAPAGTNNTVTTNEDAQYTFVAVDFGLTDPNDSPANVLSAVRITTIPGLGSLTLSGIAVTAGQSISAANIASGNLKFTPTVNASGASYASFTFQVQDDGGTANGGVDLDASPNTMTINVSAVNDAPSGTNTTVTTLEDAAYTLGASDFGFSDPNDSPADTMSGVNIASLPGAGTLALSGVAVSVGQFVSIANINAGNLKFTPAVNANGVNYATLDFQVQDTGGTANGGSNIDATPNTLALDVTAVNDAPVFASNALTITQGGSVVFSSADLNAVDIDTATSSLVITPSAVSQGHFELIYAPGVTATSFTESQVASGQVRFVHDGSTSAPSYSLMVSDGFLISGPTAATINFAPGTVVTPVIPPPAPPTPPAGAVTPAPAPGPTPAPTPPTAPGAGSTAVSRTVVSAPAVAPVAAPANPITLTATEPTKPIIKAVPSSIRNADWRGFGDNQKALAPAFAEAIVMQPAELTVLTHGMDPRYMDFGPGSQNRWTIEAPFAEETVENSKGQLSVLEDSTEMGGIALSVGAVWWASRVSGVIGSLMLQCRRGVRSIRFPW